MDIIKFTSKQPRSAICNVPSDIGSHDSVLKLSRYFATSGVVTVCSTFFNIEKKKNAIWPHIVFMYFKLFYEKASIICLKLSH